MEYSLLERTIEGELIPLAQDAGMGVLPWSPLKSGFLSGKYRRDQTGPTDTKRSAVLGRPSEAQFTVIEALASVAEEIGASPAAVALSWVQNRPGVSSTLIGPRTLEHLESNLAGLEELSPRPQPQCGPDAQVRGRHRGRTDQRRVSAAAREHRPLLRRTHRRCAGAPASSGFHGFCRFEEWWSATGVSGCRPGERPAQTTLINLEGFTMTATAARTAEQTTDVPEIADPSKVAPKDARELSKLFFDQLEVLEEGTPEYQYARNTLIEMNMSLVRFAAGRFRSRGPEEMEDIVQVGMIGLIKAIDRFELSREVEFTSFAVPYIVGEIKRFFRDTTWAVHVPRRLQEARVQLARAADELRSRLGRVPTTKELSELMSLPENEVVEAQLASNGYRSASLDAAINGSEDGEAALADFIGDEDAALGLVEDFHALAPMIAELDERERKIIHWRFVEELTQAEIGERLGVSQMHVSRLLSRLLAGLREGMLSTT
jgi:RNA polymerase sigma-B factor